MNGVRLIMKNAIKFILFLLYSTSIFFIPNGLFILIPLAINVVLSIITKTSLKKIVQNLLKFMTFILFTFAINCLLDTYTNAVWVAMKLLLVCNITFIYSQTTSANEIAKTVRKLVTPLKVFKINPDEIEVLVSISLSMIPILKSEVADVKEACKAKNIPINIKNMKIILSKLMISILKRVSQIDEALVEKGYDY